MKHFNYIFAIIMVSTFVFSSNLNAVDYVIRGKAQLTEFLAGAPLDPNNREVVNNLTIKDNLSLPSETTEDKENIITSLAGIVSRVKEVTGKVTWDSLFVDNTEGFFDQIKCAGASIHIKNCPKLIWTNGFKPTVGENVNNGGYRIIGGDFILENLPNIAHTGNGGWTVGVDCFSSIEEVKGSYRLINIGGWINSNINSKLLKVGGDYEISGITNKGTTGTLKTFTSFENFKVQEIGGKLIFNNNEGFMSLRGCHGLLYVGNGATMLNNPLLPIYSTETWGLCYLKYMKDEGIIEGTLEANFNGSAVDVDNLVPCADGFSSETGVNNPQASNTILNLSTLITDGKLTIESTADLKKIELIDILGKSVFESTNIPTGRSQHNISNLSRNVYLIKIVTQDDNIETYKIIIS